MSSQKLPNPVKAWSKQADLGETLHLFLEYAPSAFAITRGPSHTVVYANSAFRSLAGTPLRPGFPLLDILLPEAGARIRTLLDRALANSEVLHDRFVGSLPRGNDYWSCTIWPFCHSATEPAGLVVELQRSAHRTSSPAILREVTERLLLVALEGADAAERAQSALTRSNFMSEAGRLLAASLDTSVTRSTVAGISLPVIGAWCIVDLIEADGSTTRLSMIHPDPRKQELLRELARDWQPERGDPFGAPAMSLGSPPLVIDHDVEAALEVAAHSSQNLQVLHELEITSLLTVPMVIGNRLIGALTFLTDSPGRHYSSEDIQLAQGLAERSAEALESARSYEEALLLRGEAEDATQSRMRFLGNISHELRTPLNAIMGYIDLMAEEIHGPVTPAQRNDLARIRLNHGHLLNLVNELLSFVRAGAPRTNTITALPANDALARAFGLIENMLARKGLRYRSESCDATVIALGDPERVTQILVNLLANAVKFTPKGGQITTRCEAVEDWVFIRVIDDGIGIDASKLDAIFEPFIQVDPGPAGDSGIGLGLAISRELARTMDGNLTVQSKPGEGSCFTLSLPRMRTRKLAESRQLA
ncbi:MAG: PAS domain-containing sensor histidine kinase [Gemmatimonadota bacterium]